MSEKEVAQEAQAEEVKESAVIEEVEGLEADSVPGAEVQEASAELLQSELEKAQAELVDAKNQVLRAHAEAQNVRRRAEQDVEKAHKYALEKFTNELLPVVDSLERAIESAQSEEAGIGAIRDGVELTLNMFVAALKKFNVESVNPEGEPFDPQLHQAMSMVENAEVEPNTVLHVMQKGYQLNGRLVRPAMVMVSKAAPQAAPKIDDQA
ncbi:nucleotide exchange factor GrpE [Motiliproteus sp. MSK22-1]|uniref:nucleotide exchange factor GrpE n=1 Tax=Motiliproteus sp. MSK22-1 TaxID=1897630 RepID=UPI0009783E40|nr:nucleotide exchange factor GrpE [Motiliproteus sp. MSK22-1]OMH39349.1 nucleotide exchange factor GrpE [Motiliproteus sp. MSK22-1]